MERGFIWTIILSLSILFSGCINTDNSDNTLNSTNRPASVIEAEDHYVPHWVK